MDATGGAAALIECEICYCELDGASSLRELSTSVGGRCEHAFCRPCLSSHCRTQIQEGLVTSSSRSLQCPQHGCDGVVAHSVVQELVEDPRLFAIYDEAVTVRCPRPGCRGRAEIFDRKCGQCTKCGLAFCLDCRKTYHGSGLCDDERKEMQAALERETKTKAEKEEEAARRGPSKTMFNEVTPFRIPTKEEVGADCHELMTLARRHGVGEARKHVVRVITDMISSLSREERVQLAKKYLQGTEAERAELDEFYGKAYIAFYASGMNSLSVFTTFLEDLGHQGQDNVRLMNTLALISGEGGAVRPCPHCFVPIEKVGGCKVMWCTACKTSFCWKCSTFPIESCRCDGY